jgi:hypothetical protein
LKLSDSILIGLLTASIFSLAIFCAGQSAPAQTSDPTQSTQPPATSPPPQNQPVDQSPAQSNSQDQSGPVKKDPTQKDSTQEDTNKNKEDTKKKDDRMFYVMPNYLTVNGQSQVKPISWKEKFAITAKGTFDPYEFAIVGVVAGIRQAENSYPAFGQGAEGYAKRYGAAFADQVDGNIMVGGLYPSILKTDPRYFRLGEGRMAHRFAYAISRVFVARKDSGGSMFNVPEFAGNATAIAISNVYYPAADRSFSASATNWGVQMGIDAFGNELKEFWPDVHNYLQNRHNRHEQKQQTKAAAEDK